MKIIVNSIGQFITGLVLFCKAVLSELTGEPSVKRVSAAYVLLILITGSQEFITWTGHHAMAIGKPIDASVLDICHLLGNVVIPTEFAFVATALGITAYQSVKHMQINSNCKPGDTADNNPTP